MRSAAETQALAWRMGVRLATLVLATLVAGSLASLYLAQIRRVNDAYADGQRETIRRLLESHRATLESALNQRLATIHGLAAFASSNVYNIDPTFESFSSQLIRYGGAVHSVELARNAVVSSVYPQKGNEGVLGRDLLKDPELRASAQAAIKNGGLVVDGPFALPDGGVGVIGLEPVYVLTQHPSAQTVVDRSLWGLAALELDLLPPLEEAGLVNQDTGINYAIRSVGSNDLPGKDLWGDASLFDRDSMRSEVRFPGGTWLIAGMPVNGWHGGLPYASAYRAAVILGALLLVGLVLWLNELFLQWRSSIESHAFSARDAEERVRTFFRNASEAVLLLDSEGRFQDVNQAFADIIGYSIEELRGKGLRDFTAPEQDIRVVNVLLKSWRLGRGVGECILRRKDGTDVQVEFSMAKLQADPSHSVLMAIGHDITERKTREDILLRHSHELEVRDAVSSAISGTTDVKEIMRLGLNRAREFLEYDLAQSYLVARKDPPRLEWAMAEGADDALVALSRESVFYLGQGVPGRVLEARKPQYILDIRYEDNMPRRPAAKTCGYQSVIGVPLISRGEVIGIMEFFSHQRKAVSESDTSLLSSIGEQIGLALENARLYEKIRASEADFRSLFENSVEGIYRSTMSGQFLNVNPALVRMLGYDTVEEVLSLDMSTQVYADAGQRQHVIDSTRETEIIRGIEFRWKRKDGSVLDVRYNGRKVRDANGAFLYYEGFVEDMTERNRLQKELIQSQKMETIGTMAGGIAHDFNNQLTVILGNLDLGLMESPQGTSLADCLQNATRAARRCAELTRSILTFGRQMTSEPRPMSLNAAVDESVRLLERSFPAHIRLNVQKLGDLWTVNADPTQMQQILMNLCVNARDAMPDGGMMTVRTSNCTLTEAERSGHAETRPGRFACLTVEDTGSGIPAEVLPRIFEPFFTTKEVGKGTGLGLAMVYGIAKSHNGWVQVSSELGRGTVFTVFIPATEAAVTEEKAQVVTVPGGHETILVVDDEELVLGLARTILERHGYAVLTAYDGLDALDVFQANADRVDAIVLDLNMPRMTGLEAIPRMREIRPDVPIIISSGYRADAEARSAIESGAAGVVQKPYSPSVMALAVRKALDARRAAPPKLRKPTPEHLS